MLRGKIHSVGVKIIKVNFVKISQNLNLWRPLNPEAQKKEEEKKQQEEAIKQQQGRLSDTNTGRLRKSLDNQNFRVFTQNFSRNAL